ncbi:MAG: UDP-N-acetylmuramate dehydrogenase [Gammaproteobacteria bacterium]|nr:MAG: UDP-N-acetylmuramate dehydrogenase [Gammaproteobacteria bacterium]
MSDAVTWMEDADLATSNSLRLPSRARWLVSVPNAPAAVDALTRASAKGLTLWVLGEGSNVVLPPRLDGLVLRVSDEDIRILEHRGDSVRLRVGAGVHWDALVHWAAERDFWGIENLALIPGSVGAAPVQNIGAYGQELASSCIRVQAVERTTRRICWLDAAACAFGYRDSRFRREPGSWVITALELSLRTRGQAEVGYAGVRDILSELGLAGASPVEMVRAISTLRRRKLPDPAELPNAGSFFKNPVVSLATFEQLRGRDPDLPGTATADGIKLSAAWLIDRCGWRGFRRGGVGVAPQHALVLVHHGGADARALLALAADIAASVRDRFGVQLEREPTDPVGPEPAGASAPDGPGWGLKD